MKERQITEEMLELPFKELIKVISEEKLIPSVYGNALGYKLIKDLDNFKLIPSSFDRGDACVNKEIFCEIKTSIIKKPERKGHRITHMRFYQRYDFYILLFVNVPNNYDIKIFVIKKYDLEGHQGLKFTAMNGTKASNTSNTNIDQSTTIKKEDLDWLFLKYNQLNGTSYETLINYLKNIGKN